VSQYKKNLHPALFIKTDDNNTTT
jgi:hypothetical protein